MYVLECLPSKQGSGADKILCVHFRLNFRLNQACKDVLKETCTEVCADQDHEQKACGGTVLRCLADKIDDINDDACKQELLYFQKMEVCLAAVYCIASYAELSAQTQTCLL